MKKFLAIILAAILLLSMVSCGGEDANEGVGDLGDHNANAAVLQEGDFIFEVNESGDYDVVTYTYSGAATRDVVIPATYRDRPVTGIGDSLFKASRTLKSVSIPASVKTIGDSAFFDCDLLTEVVIPDSVIAIGNSAFMDCSALTKVTLSSSLRSIGDLAFRNCEVLGNFVLPETLMTIGFGAFEGCKALTEVTIPTSVFSLGKAAFFGCESLSSVTMLGDASEEDKAILAKANAALAESLTVIRTLSDVSNALIDADMYLGDITDDGANYIWDFSDYRLVGAITAADAELLTQANTALAAAKAKAEEESTNVPKTLSDILATLAEANIHLDTLNNFVSASKYFWNAELGVLQSVLIGDNAFDGCAETLTVSVTANSVFAEYALYNGYTVVA